MAFDFPGGHGDDNASVELNSNLKIICIKHPDRASTKSGRTRFDVSVRLPLGALPAMTFFAFFAPFCGYFLLCTFLRLFPSRLA
jgi:hypothetical protein